MAAEFLTKGISFGEESEYTKALPLRESSNHWETVTMWFSVFILSVFPLLSGTDSYYNITESKYYYFTIATVSFLVLVGFIELSYFLDKPLGAKRFSGGIQKLNLPQIFVILYFASASISSILSGYVKETLVGVTRFEGLLTIIMYSCIFVFLSFWGEFHEMYLWFNAISTTIFGVLAIMALCGLDLLSPEGLSFADHHFIGTMGNIDMLGAYVSIVVPILAATYVIIDTKLRYLTLLPMVLLMYLQFFSDVDSSKMGLLAFLVVTIPFLANTRKHFAKLLMVFSMAAFAFGLSKLFVPTGLTVNFIPGKKAFLMIAAASLLAIVSLLLEHAGFEFPFDEKKMEIILAVLIAVCIVCALVFVYNYSGDFLLLKEASQVMHGEISDSIGTGRGGIWKNTWKEILKKPVFGGGPGVFVYIYSGNADILNNVAEGKLTDFAHNDFLQVAACQGFVGLFFYLAFIVSLFVRSLKVANKNPIVIIFVASCVSYLVHSFFSFSIAIITPLFWVIAGLLDKTIRQTLPPDLRFKALPESENRKEKKNRK